MKRPVIGLSMNYMQLGSYHQFHIRDTYIDAIYNHGGLPLPIICTTDRACLTEYFKMIDAIIIIGGLDYPPSMYGEEPHPTADIAHERRAYSDPLLVEFALETQTPLLGICAGMQLMNITTGGKLIQHLDTVVNHYGEKYHKIKILGGKWLPQIFTEREITVNSNHHQGLNPDFIGKGYQVVAMAEDGVIEAIEYDTPGFALGIQWHPERILDIEHQKKFFTFLFEIAGKKRD